MVTINDKLLTGDKRDNFLKEHLIIGSIPQTTNKPEPKPDTTYNGWKNRATWNVALYLYNEEGLYNDACRFMREYEGKTPYKQFICSRGLRYERTPDNFKFLGSRLCYKELNEMMKDLIE